MKLYNTLTRQIEPLQPLQAGKINLFVCGPTVYDLSHIGHAKTYTQFDILARTLRYFGYQVDYLQNITNIDDKIIDRANEQGRDWQELSADFEQQYKRDMADLGVISVDTYARATDYIDDIRRQVKILLDKGHAYVISGDGIYFEISTFKDYGKLAGRTKINQDDSQSRIDESGQKRGWNDFCLWKFSKPQEPVWPADFGDGRPGWHIEDTAITEHHFGQQYDIHGGAVDLIFPHHEAEITQMESISGLVPFVRHWVHTGFLNISQAKMSKSAGNYITIREALAGVPYAQVLRLYFLQSHYRSSADFSWEALSAVKVRFERLLNFAELRHQAFDYDSEDEIEVLTRASHDIESALKNDLNTPRVLEILSETMDNFEAGLSHHSLKSFEALLNTLDMTLGLDLQSLTPRLQPQPAGLIKQRQAARDRQDFAEADRLRRQLAKVGVVVKDTPHGPVWQRQLD